MRVTKFQPRKVGGEFYKNNKHFINRDDRLQSGFRVEAHKWFLQRFSENPKRRVRVKQEIDHNHSENCIWCSCGFRRHNKRGWVGEMQQKGKYRKYTGQS